MMLCLFTVSLFGVVAADVLITYPAGGEVLSGIQDYTVTWEESNIVPVISDLGSYTIFLYAGTNENYVCPHPPVICILHLTSKRPQWPRPIQALSRKLRNS